MGRVYLNDENKLVVITSNGRIEGNKTTTEITDEEKFEIDAESISKLLVILNDVNLMGYKLLYSKSYYTVISKDEICKKLDEEIKIAKTASSDYAEAVLKLKELEEKYDASQKELFDLKEKINKYNQNQRRFWHPIKIED